MGAEQDLARMRAAGEQFRQQEVGRQQQDVLRRKPPIIAPTPSLSEAQRQEQPAQQDLANRQLVAQRNGGEFIDTRYGRGNIDAHSNLDSNDTKNPIVHVGEISAYSAQQLANNIRRHDRERWLQSPEGRRTPEGKNYAREEKERKNEKAEIDYKGSYRPS